MSGEFEKWIESYPESIRHEFHPDGIVDEPTFCRERLRLLFVAKEPNSKDGNYDKYRGTDLRTIWRDVRLKKPFDRNVARWTKIVLDGVDPGSSMTWEDVGDTIRRVAIINLKKMAGSGSEDREVVCLYAFKDREFIREQITRIAPDLIFACGKDGFVARMIWRIMNDEICLGNAVGETFSVQMTGRLVPVFSVYHPSLRPMQQDEAAIAIRKIKENIGA